jgi:uncharacterized protein
VRNPIFSKNRISLTVKKKTSVMKFLEKSSDVPSVVSKALIQTILEQHALPWYSVHGISHWARVFENGCQLAQLTGAKIEVVQLFAVFHDSRREHDGRDFQHGQHGAEYAATLRGTHFNLLDEDFDLLYTACAHHTDSLTQGDITVQTCWDADRLDLGRVGIRPNPNYLCTDAAKEADMISWANQRAIENFLPKWVYKKWGYSKKAAQKKRGFFFLSGRGASRHAFPRRAWERGMQ